MLSTDDLRAVLERPAESTTLDFKERIEWADRAAKLELARDIVCLANRNGGLLIVGVADAGGGRFNPVGLPAGESLPDPTEIARLVANHFDPPVMLTASELSVDGHRYGVIQVDEFQRTPHICKRIGQIPGAPHPVFRPGDLLRRSDLLECSRVDSAEGLQHLIESAAMKTGAIVGSMLRSVAPTVTVEPAGSLTEPTRACDLWPVPPTTSVSPRQLPGLLEAATVHSRGGVLIPRAIDVRRLASSEFVREPSRILAETSRGLRVDDGRSVSVVELTTGLSVRLRERLWEPEGKIDFTSLVAFVVGSLLFGQRLYSAASVDRFAIRVGLLSPTGLALTTDSARYWPMSQTYVATTTVDVLVDRELSTETDASGRAEIARGIVEEIAWYFGFTLADGVFEAHLTNTRENVPGV